ncbi:alpha/beta fold family hydrolase [Rahnella aquatilis CIP 78.65 = ATCC 33071]|uniref:Putative hydrolase or acyltransferase of alpha/beta superfamily n=1 Tax=Rahnella aquatilis (strain ATCC 33071 / DSM 4594 / JCM 1683 / NBRC 105701 / NCIMB 13365 / CIP 78.65) TaxID=745277 RepID=H2IQX4_RAHAC|nr:alpha/beta hydrolase [Rahnella aquatilis]AEX52497.1 putative hydrolase or acyltransferase of alpha/beta superfamily [Rahnella aquatilis CIP 78.65 = ATCC 33071]KFD06903.1 alpha/beta fold family hydrolase [Rahnella aquatilis CIP 78.65 = ATCC 33071]
MLPRFKLLFWATVLSFSFSGATMAADAPSYGPQLQGFDYPFPLKQFSFNSQGAPLQMGYLDVAPTGHKNGQTVVLMHGKNFCAATWGDTISALVSKGYRVIAPDQVGFCSSTKPSHYQYSFQQLATNTHDLLKSLKITKAVIVGHSTGGMLATRYSLMYAPEVSKLVLVNPIGLEDWKAKGVPYRTVDQWYDRELKTSADSIKQYELKTYYVNKWKPEYDRWVDMLAGLNNGPGHKLVAWNSALIYDMIFTQPVFYEFKNLRVPTTLMIGTADTTAIGSDIAPPAVKAKIGHYNVLGKQVTKLIPHAKLIEFKGLGHAPQMEEPEKFNAALLKTLAR